MQRFLLISTLLFSSQIWANTYLQDLNTLIFENETAAAQKIKVAASAGLGNYISSVDVNLANAKPTEGLTNTNRKFVNVGLSINDFDLQTKIQYKDPEKSRLSRVDTNFSSYQLGYQIENNLKTEIYYQSIDSFYLEDLKKEIVTNRFNNLGITRTGIIFNYLTNPKHKSPLLDPMVYNKIDSSGSWVLSTGFNYFRITGMQDFDQLIYLPEEEKVKTSQSVGVDTRMTYSSMWFGKNWFLGGALGLALGLNQYKNTTNSGDLTETKSSLNSIVSLSTGYLWKRATAGVYITMNSWNYEIRDYRIRYSSGSSGMYASYTF